MALRAGLGVPRRYYSILGLLETSCPHRMSLLAKEAGIEQWESIFKLGAGPPVLLAQVSRDLDNGHLQADPLEDGYLCKGQFQDAVCADLKTKKLSRLITNHANALKISGRQMTAHCQYWGNVWKGGGASGRLASLIALSGQGGSAQAWPGRRKMGLGRMQDALAGAGIFAADNT